MGEVRRRNGNSFKLISNLVEHLPEILETLCVRKLGHRLLGVFGSHIYITEGYNVCQSCLVKIVDDLPTSVSDPDVCQIYFPVCTYDTAVAGRVCFCVDTA